MKWIVLCLSILLTGCTSSKDFILLNGTKVTEPQAKPKITEINIPEYEYRIQSHDRISVTMYTHPELGTSSAQNQKEDKRGILVTSKGYINLPFIKKVHVAGLTEEEAKEKIEKAFHNIKIDDAELYIEVLNKRAYITGEVNVPGEIPLFNERLALMQVIAKAGGLKDSANRQAIVIMQKRENKVYTKTVDLTSDTSLEVANMMIYPNDTIYVTPNNMKVYNVGVQEAVPTFQLTNSIANPIINARYLSN